MPDRATADQPYLFISYASADRARVLPVVDALERAGIGVWVDREGIHGGANYGQEIARAIKDAAALALMASSLSLASRNVKQEIAVAWEYERPYLPLLLEPVAIPDDLKYWLTAAQWIEMLDKEEQGWLPAVLDALAPLGIIPKAAEREEVRLAGREKELALLREKLVSAKGGKGGLALIGGEAGIGKTTLADAVLRDAMRQGFVVLEGHCFDLAETPPYGPFIDLFARYDPPPASPPLPDAFAQRGTVGAVASQMALFVQVQDFLAALGRQRPVVMLLDDVHWADAATLDLLRFLARSVAVQPLLILATYRSDELTRQHPLYQMLPELVRAEEAARIDLGRLDDDAIRALVRERYRLPELAGDRLAAYVQGRAEGNALFVGELLRSLEEGGALERMGDEWHLGDLTVTSVPALLRHVIDGRVSRLGSETQRLLSVAAVIGYEVPLAVWATVAESDEDAMLTIAEQGLDARLLVEASGGERVRFAHALIRETLYEGIPAIRRRRIHRRVAEALAAAPRPDPDTVANHFQRADDERALPWLLLAGERAQAAYAWTMAVARFEAALALMERADADAGERGWLLVRLASLLHYAEVAKARAFVDEALACGVQAADDALVAYARFHRGQLACFAGDPTGMGEMEAGVAARAALPDTARAHLDARIAGLDATSGDWRGTVMFWRSNVGQLHAARALGEQLLAETAASGMEMLTGGADGYLGLGGTYAALGMPEEAAEMYDRAHDGYLRLGSHALAFVASGYKLDFVMLPYRTEDIAGRRRLAEQAEREHGRVSGAFAAFGAPHVVRLPLLILAGEWEEAERLAEVGSAADRGNIGVRMMSLRNLATLARLRGNTERAWWAVRRGLPTGSARQSGPIVSFFSTTALQRVAAALALDEGDLPTAKEWLDAHDRGMEWSGSVLGQSEGQALWAQYYRQAGDTEQAYMHAERALAHATDPRQPLALLAAHRLLGELDTDAGRYDDAAKHLDASLTLAEACEAPYERALTLLAMTELHSATGEIAVARTLLDEVKAICAPLGAKPARARTEALADRLATG